MPSRTDPTNRRTVLTGIVAAVFPVTGCASFGGDRSKATDGGSESVENLSVSVPSGSADDFTIDPRIVSGFDSDSPATIRLALTNTGGRRTVRFASPPPFGGTASSQGPGRLFLITPDELGANPTGERHYVPKTPTEECWEAAHVPSYGAVAADRTMESGQTIARDYYVLGDPSDDSCVPDGQYRFDSSYEISPSTGGSKEFELGFVLTVDRE